MTKKTLIKLARVINEAKLGEKQRDHLTFQIGIIAQFANRAFRWDKWEAACLKPREDEDDPAA